MQTASTIHLGFEIGTGAPISIPVGHTVVTGATQLSGKTSTLEALISRSGRKAIAFVTKRAEGSLLEGHRLPPYFRERADWRFVESIIEATMREKNRIIRASIIKASRGARNLAGVLNNVERRLTGKKQARGFEADMYLQLSEYLKIVIPQIDRLPYTKTLKLETGLNVMDLAAYSTEVQALVIRSVLEWIYENENEVISIIPEAWEMLPQKRSSPVMLAAESLIRKGGASKNYLYLDSQDLAGIQKDIVRQCQVWILGVQREMNEVKRTLSHIPAGVGKPKAEDVMQLGKGEFFACFGREVHKVYVQPAWLDEDHAQEVAVGGLPLPEPPVKAKTFFLNEEHELRDSVAAMAHIDEQLDEEESTVTEAEAKALDTSNALLREENEQLSITVNELQRQVDDLKNRLVGKVIDKTPFVKVGDAVADKYVNLPTDERTYQMVKARLLEESPGILKLITSKPEIHISVERHTVEARSDTLFGACALLISEGFFDSFTTGGSTLSHLKTRGISTAPPNIYPPLNELVGKGFLYKDGKNGFKAVEGMKDSIIVKRHAA